MEFLPYIIPAIGFIGGAGAFVWRLGAMEKNAERRDEQAREDRKELHTKINENTKDIAQIKGYLQGKGEINE